MFIAHMPAAYLLGKVIAQRWPQAMQPAAWCALLLGSIAPDFDLLYFYLLSDRSINHHVYPPHVPIVWLLTAVLGFLALRAAPQRWRAVCTTPWVMLCTGWWLHLALDTVAGGIWWLWPWVTTPYVLMVVPRRFDNAWLNLLSHPMMAIEVLIVATAAWRWRMRSAPVRSRRRNFSMQMPKRPYRTFL
jgi:membrane-bound metal-dependent hydrolase YbcI (DUF457 family)